jgi:hypothetical protein
MGICNVPHTPSKPLASRDSKVRLQGARIGHIARVKTVHASPWEGSLKKFASSSQMFYGCACPAGLEYFVLAAAMAVGQPVLAAAMAVDEPMPTDFRVLCFPRDPDQRVFHIKCRMGRYAQHQELACSQPHKRQTASSLPRSTN